MNDLTHKFDLRAKHPLVAQSLRLRIARGTWARGAQLPHRDELEAQLGASRATVQTALNTLQHEGFLRGVAGRGTFVAERLPFDTNYGLLFPLGPEGFAQHRFFASIEAAARTVASQQACTIHSYFQVTNDDSADRPRVLSDCAEHRLGGVIFAFPPGYMRHSAFAQPDAPPRVAIMDKPDAHFAGPCVYPDWHAFYQLAFKRLASQGKKRIAVITCDSSPELPKTLAKLASSLRVDCAEEHVQVVHPDHLHLTRRVIPLLFSAPERARPDALIIGDDNLVEHATASLLTLPRLAPAIVAHACVPHAPVCHLPCETLVFDNVQLVQKCVEIIREQRAGRRVPPRTLLAPGFQKIDPR